MGVHGYAQFQFDKKLIRAHRFSYELHYGPIPEGLHVYHHCDVRDCVNPHHLFAGTQLNNIRDMDAKGRRVRAGLPGERNPRAKLTGKQVREIRAALRVRRYGLKAELARKYGVTKAMIGRIEAGKAWQSV